MFATVRGLLMSIGHGFRASFLASAILASTFVMMGCLPEIDPAATDSTGEDLFATNCAVCHGTTGSGDGPAASSLPTQPPNLTKIAERRDGREVGRMGRDRYLPRWGW